MEYMDLISLLILCATLVAAFVFKLNSGLVAIAVSVLLARVVGIGDKTLFSYFDSKLFVMLMGVMFLFSIAQENKTLELVAKKTFALCKGNAKVLPIVLFFVSAVISAIGPGLISVTALVSVLIVSLANEVKTPAIRLVPFGLMGAFAGGLSPVTPTGVVAIEQAAKNNITGVEATTPWMMALTCFIFSVILYFFVFKWHKEKATPVEQNADAQGSKESFSAKQIATLVGVLVVAVVSSVFNINVGLVSIVVAVLLLIFKCADEGAALKKMPWGTLVMITGVGILISLVTELGGIDLLSEGLKKLSTDKTIAAIMTLLSGVMSWVSSASGVVMPTLIPTVPSLVADMPGANALELVSCISIGANMAAISPLSSCGGLMLAAYTSSGNVSAKDRNKMFLQLFLLSASALLLSGILALLGLY